MRWRRRWRRRWARHKHANIARARPLHRHRAHLVLRVAQVHRGLVAGAHEGQLVGGGRRLHPGAGRRWPRPWRLSIS
eukprot:COSAG01_NODE_783_length_13630_cov_5.556459_21_plen_77_part_00